MNHALGSPIGILNLFLMWPQRFAQMSYFQQSVLEHVAADMLTLHTAERPQLTRLGSFLWMSRAATPDASVHRSALLSNCCVLVSTAR